LQHPLGVAFAGGMLYVADTYNNKIKSIDLAKKTVHTIDGTGKPGRDDSPASFDEPAGLSAAGDKLYVADTNNHLIRTIDLAHDNRVATLEIKGLTPPRIAEHSEQADATRGSVVRAEPVTLKPQDGLVWLAAKLALPEGYKINPDAPMKYKLTAPGGPGPVDASGIGRSVKVDPPMAAFQVEIPLAQGSGETTVEVALDYYYCQEGPSGICKTGRVTWSVPLKIASTASTSTAPLQFKVE
jgi:hypothetical protein